MPYLDALPRSLYALCLFFVARGFDFHFLLGKGEIASSLRYSEQEFEQELGLFVRIRHPREHPCLVSVAQSGDGTVRSTGLQPSCGEFFIQPRGCEKIPRSEHVRNISHEITIAVIKRSRRLARANTLRRTINGSQDLGAEDKSRAGNFSLVKYGLRAASFSEQNSSHSVTSLTLSTFEATTKLLLTTFTNTTSASEKNRRERTQ